MIPFTRDDDGLRDYRPALSLGVSPTRRLRWPWLVLILTVLGGLLVRVWR